jgi:hypothetical protein
MIMPSDADYKQTKRLKTAGTPLASPLKELAEWIEARYDVHVLNIILDTVEPHERARLNVVMEWEQEALKFRQNIIGFDAARQREVREQFVSIASDVIRRRLDLTTLFVIFTSFESVARLEANGRVTDRDLERLKKRMNDEDLWKIRPRFAGVTFFFYTDAQLRVHEADGFRERVAKAYAELVAPYDEFGYLAKRGVLVELDSKERFDSVYQSNWFYYDR